MDREGKMIANGQHADLTPPRRFMQFTTSDGHTIRLRAYQVALIDAAPGGGAIIEAIIKDTRRTYRTDAAHDDLLAAHSAAMEDEITIEAV
jgi:hypothetical protein